MFHVKHLYVRVDLKIPGITLSHIAELAELNTQACRPLRMIQIGQEDAISGLVDCQQGSRQGIIDVPKDTVPHPNAYAEFEDVLATDLSAEEFEALWQEARVLFPEHKDQAV